MRKKLNIRILLFAFFLFVVGLGALQFIRPADYTRILGTGLGGSPFLPVAVGVVLLLAGIAVFSGYTFGSRSRSGGATRLPVVVGGVVAALVIAAHLAAKNWALLEILEYSARLATPWILYLGLLFLAGGGTGSSQSVFSLVRAVSALTFIGHGLYALNLVPGQATPESFYEMIENCLGFGETEEEKLEWGRNFLTAVGILDLLAAVGLYFRGSEKAAILYMVVWGFLTALARPWAYFEADAALLSLRDWIPEFLARAPHFLLPAFLMTKPRQLMGSGRLDISGL